MKRVFVIHCWGGTPEGNWYSWAAHELREFGFHVSVLKMLNAEMPHIEEWVSFLAQQVGKCDAETYFIGHSIGCQTILRYLERLSYDVVIGGVVFVAPWIKLNMDTIQKEGVGVIRIAREWQETPIDFQKVLPHLPSSRGVVSIFSDNDYYVVTENQDIFREKLGSRILIEHGKGHFVQDDGVTDLPILLEVFREHFLHDA